MITLLAIDTSSPCCSVALAVNNGIIQRSSEAERQSAQKVLPMISELLSSAQLTLNQLDVIAVMAGPGSFTGLRIGIGVTQGLSMANSIPALPLSTLAVSAMAAVRESNSRHLLVSQRARGDEVYFGAYLQSDQAGVVLAGTEQVCVPSQVCLPLELNSTTREWVGVGDGWKDHQQIESKLGIQLQGPVIQPIGDIGDLCELAKLRFALGEAIAAEQVMPNYIKEQLDYS